MVELNQKVYRYIDGYVDHNMDTCEPYLTEYYVVKITPKGFKVSCWSTSDFDPSWSDVHQILTNARIKFAHETKEDAYKSYIARKKKQLEHIQSAKYRVAKRLKYLELNPTHETNEHVKSNIFKFQKQENN